MVAYYLYSAIYCLVNTRQHAGGTLTCRIYCIYNHVYLRVRELLPEFVDLRAVVGVPAHLLISADRCAIFVGLNVLANISKLRNVSPSALRLRSYSCSQLPDCITGSIRTNFVRLQRTQRTTDCCRCLVRHVQRLVILSLRLEECSKF